MLSVIFLLCIIPHQIQADNSSFINTVTMMRQHIQRRNVEPIFRGHPKTREERWHENFGTDRITAAYKDADSLVQLLNKIVAQYLNKCVPIVLYDAFVESVDSIMLETLFKLLTPIDNSCRSYILFLSDINRARDILGPQMDNRVIIVSRSSQWKQQEFLSSKVSSDIINLLVISKSMSASAEKADAYVLYTHRLYTDGLASNKPAVLTSWTRGRLSRPHINLFPTKFLRGFSGHRFIISALHQPPFVVKKTVTDPNGNVHIEWDGLEMRIIRLLAKRLNFTYEIYEPKGEHNLGPTFGVLEDVSKRVADIGLAGIYVTIERLDLIDMSVQHSKDCAAFITLTSTSLPRYRAIMGPFQWPVWLAIIATYLIAIFPLAFSDRLTLRHLIGNWSEMENMFWYVFGTFTNSLTFTGQFSWSNTKRNSTRMLIGWYWVFTIIITACYTGSIIAFVTLPVFPDTVDSIDDLLWGFYRIGSLENDGWQFWFTNSSHALTKRLLKNQEYVANVEEGLSNVTKAFFWPYAFLGSKSQLEYIVQANYTDEEIGKRTALHISDECLSIFGIAFAFPPHSVYANRFNNAILRLHQSGFIAKIDDDLQWESNKLSQKNLLKISSVSTLSSTDVDERGLTLADTEGMFLLMAIGYTIAAAVLISEIIGGCANKCREIANRRAEHRRLSKERRRRNSEQQQQQQQRQLSANQSIAAIEYRQTSSSESFEITQQMLQRKSLHDGINPFVNLYNRGRRRAHSLATSFEHHNRNVSREPLKHSAPSKSSGDDEDRMINAATNDLSNVIELDDHNLDFQMMTTVQINRCETPANDDDGNPFGERIN